MLIFRIGTNLGEVIVEGEDIHCDGVNIAARLESLSETSGICLSGDDAYRQVRRKIEARFEDLGDQDLKNVAEPVRVYRIAADQSVAVASSSKLEALPLPIRPSVAVLPFQALGGDAGQADLCIGLVADTTTELENAVILLEHDNH